jgi:CRP/FNR family transcriptional regulator
LPGSKTEELKKSASLKLLNAKPVIESVENSLFIQFPDIYEPEARKMLLEKGHVMHIAAGELLMDIGQYIKFMPFVLEGSLKVMREDAEGHELLLYYINPGETCAMSLTCCQGNSKSNVRAVAEEDTTFLSVPVNMLDQWTSDFRSFKSFVLLSYQRRFDELLRTIDGIAFQKLDNRLLNSLKSKASASGSKTITTTHQELASELNSSREVISRLLKSMEHEGLVILGRGKIELT